MAGRNNEFIDSIKEELSLITADDMLELQKKLGLTTTDMCSILDIHYTTYQKYYIQRSQEPSALHKLFLWHSNILWERPSNYLAVHRKARSYWQGWRDAGGEIPDDVGKQYKYPLSNDVIVMDEYRRGVREWVKSKEKESK